MTTKKGENLVFVSFVEFVYVGLGWTLAVKSLPNFKIDGENEGGE